MRTVLMGVSFALVLNGAAKPVSARDSNPASRASLDVSWRPPPPPHEEGLVERFYVEDRAAPRPTGLEVRRGFILYRRAYTELIFPNSIPDRTETIDRLAGFAAAGEYEPITLAVYALRDLKGLKVEVGDLRLPDGSAVLPSEQVAVRVARCMFKRITHYSGPGEFMYMPTWLARRKSVDVAAGRSAWFWLTVRVPPDTAPGRYAGRVSVGAERTAEIPLELEVLPIRLPQQVAVNIGFYDSPSAEKLQQQRAYGMTSVGWSGSSGVKLAPAGDSLRVDLAGSAMARVLEAYHRAGFRHPILWLMGDDVWDWCTKQAPAESDRCVKLYTQALSGIRRQALDHGWPEIIVQPDDECPSHPKRMAHAERRLPLIKAAGFRTEMDHYLAYSGGGNDKWVARTIPYVDVITLRYWAEGRLGQAPWAEVADRVAKAGKELWTYNITACHMFPQPTSMRFSTGWFFRTVGRTCRGMYFWAYASTQGDPYDDLDGKYSDFRYYYPPDRRRGLSGGPSIDLVCMREGIDDLRYIEALEALIAQAGSSAAAQAARNKLRALRGSFNLSEALKRKVEGTQSVWQFLEQRGGKRIARGWFRYPNGWTAAHYDAARRTVAEAIVRLQSTLAQGGARPSERRSSSEKR